MADESAEKTEEPTGRRLEKARSEGQLARSIELPVAAMSLGAVGFFSLMGGWLFNGMSQLFVSQLEFDRKITDKAELLPGLFAQAIVDAFLLILPIMLMMYFIAIVSTVLSGGMVFSIGMVAPKFSKLNPLSGLQRIFGTKALIELGKAIAKFVVVGGILLLLADTCARTIAIPAEVPVGIFTALLGTPFFILLLRSSRRQLT